MSVPTVPGPTAAWAIRPTVGRTEKGIIVKNPLVVYESMFGQTRDVAAAIAEGLSRTGDVTCVEVSDAPTELPDDVDLLVVGAPTHAFGLSTPDTRGEARDRRSQPLVSPGIGVREWLAILSASSASASGTRAAAFDTHVRQRWVPGHAAAKTARALARMGLSAAAEPVSFYVDGTMGPLLPGELSRARAWGRALGRERSDVPAGSAP